MTALIGAILTASLLGSVHCVGMCGAFVALAVGGIDNGSGTPVRRWRLNAAYQLGRLVTYATLGVIAGSLGAAFNLSGELVGVQKAATAVAGAMLIAMAVVTLTRLAGVNVPRMPIPGVMVRTATRAHGVAATLTPARRAMAIGMLTTLLPCGWLYAFVIAAAGTANPAWGATAMAAFWLGTVPYLAALGAGVAGLTGPLREHLPVVTSLLLIVVGLYTVFGRSEAFAAPLSNLARHDDLCGQVERLWTLDPDQTCPMCAKERP